MSVRRAVAVVVLLFVIAWAVLLAVTRNPNPSSDGLAVIAVVTMASVGLIIAGKQPHNLVGWLLTAAALTGLIDVVVREYLVLDYRQHDGRLPFGWVAVEWRGGVTILAFLIGLPAILLFPDGRAPSARWRGVLWMYALLATVFTLVQFGDQATMQFGSHPTVNIRGALPNLSGGSIARDVWLATVIFLGFWLFCVVHQVRSWRRATGERRAQLKWLMSGGAVSVVSTVLLVTVGDNTSLSSRLVGDVSLLGIAFLPVTIGIGILKYRLYEIDRLISRTLAYAIVTGSLIALFLGLVVLTTRVLPISSPVGVAASTLAAAALFNPLSRRVQRFVDRRFNRARYDAEATVEAFRSHLRHAVDLETVQAGLSDAVAGAVEPTHLTVWLSSRG